MLIDIPVIIRSLAGDFFLPMGKNVGHLTDSIRAIVDAGVTRWDPSRTVPTYHLAWWTKTSAEVEKMPIMHRGTIEECLRVHREVLSKEIAEYKEGLVAEDTPPPSPYEYPFSAALIDGMYKPSAVRVPVVPSKDICEGCIAASEALAHNDDFLTQATHKCQGFFEAHQARANLSLRRASGFYKLFEAAVSKDAEMPFDIGLSNPTGPLARPSVMPSTQPITFDQLEGSTGNSKSAKKARAQQLKQHQLVLEIQKAAAAAFQRDVDDPRPNAHWTSGRALSTQEVTGLIRGADRAHAKDPHTGYDDRLRDNLNPDRWSPWQTATPHASDRFEPVEQQAPSPVNIHELVSSPFISFSSDTFSQLICR